MLAALWGSIPSPSSGVLKIGPLDLRAYGLMIALGVVAAVWLFGRRLEAAGVGTRDDASAVALWGVPAGVVGARLYHVATDWERFSGHPEDIIKIWKGGLGIPGGMVLGVAVGLLACHRRKLPLGPVLTAVAPALPLAQAIGRWGNWFNQELFGKPTKLPWALEIDDAHLPNGYTSGTTFHPTFLYESLWNLALCGLLILIGKRFKLRPGRLIAVYVLGYGIGRYWVESLRIDAAKEGGGLRLNQWMALILIAGSLAFFAIDWARHRNDPPAPEPDPDAADDEADDDLASAAGDGTDDGDDDGGPSELEEPADEGAEVPDEDMADEAPLIDDTTDPDADADREGVDVVDPAAGTDVEPGASAAATDDEPDVADTEPEIIEGGTASGRDSGSPRSTS